MMLAQGVRQKGSCRLLDEHVQHDKRSRLEGAVKVTASTLFRGSEVVTCIQYDNSSLVRSVIIQQHVGSFVGAAVLFFQYQNS